MNEKRKRKVRFISFILVLSILLVSFLAYKDILKDYFTGIDTFTLIESGRIHSLKDAARIFTERMNSGTAFKAVTKFYRPIATLSYSLDYFIWKLNPLGYHLTDLMLHLLAAVLVFFLFRILTGSRVTAWLGAIIFTLHPIMVEIVPANARRHDSLVAVFMVAALLMFLQYRAAGFKRRSFSIFSLVFYVFALGSKESAVLLPVLIFLYLLLFVFDGIHPLGKALVLAVKKCIPYLAVTLIFILWRLYVLQGFGGYPKKSSYPFFGIIHNYGLNLFVPAKLADSFFNLLPLAIMTAGIILALFSVSIFLRRFKTAGFNPPPDAPGKPRGWKLIVFSLSWLVLPLIIYLWVHVLHSRYMYISIIPFSLILAVCLVRGFSFIMQRISSSFSFFSFIHFKTVGFIVFSWITLSLVSHSPLVLGKTGWEGSSAMSSIFFQKLSNVVPGFPNDAAINIYRLPKEAYLRRHSISSWLNLNFPGNRYTVVLKSMMKFPAHPEKLTLKVRKGGEKEFGIYCRTAKPSFETK